MSAWGLDERRTALERASREGVDVLVVGGGITGAGVLRDAASRGLSALLVERLDFACGTSSRSSKMIHGGLRYLAHGQFAVTRQAVQERDLLARLNPNLVRPLDFLFPAWRGGKTPYWQVRAALSVYAALANFRRSSRFKMLGADEVAEFCPGLRQDGLRGAGVYRDAEVDDARLVLEVLKSARRLGAEAVNRAEVVGFERNGDRRIRAVQVHDELAGVTVRIPAHAVVNAAGPGVERVRGLDRPTTTHSLRPAKGVHLVIPRQRIPARGTVAFEGLDGRHLFLFPWDDVAIIGTTDTWTSEIDEPIVTIEEAHYLLGAANRAFPHAALTTNDLRCVYAGVRPLVGSPDDGDKPPSSVSRDHQVWDDPCGLVSAAGGKLTTHRATGEEIVDRVLHHLPDERRKAAGPSRTAELPLRDDAFERAELEEMLCARYELDSTRAARLVRTWGADAERLLEEAPVEERRPIGRSRFSFAEIGWSLRNECATSLCDLLERRLRLALLAEGQGLLELEEIADSAAIAAGWDADRRRAECEAYREAVCTRYQIHPAPARVKPAEARSAAA